MGLVAGGLGISLVPRLAHTAPPPGVVIVPLTGVPPKRHVFVACRAGRGVLARDPRGPGRAGGQRAPPVIRYYERLDRTIIFDLDGVLVDSEQAWDQARRDVVAAHGGAWKDSATRDMLGMSSKEWPVYVVEQLGAQLTPDEVNARRRRGDAAPATASTCRCCPAPRRPSSGSRRPHTLGLASSSNRPVIDVVLQTMGVTDRFAATVSSEEVERGKPAPDVYLEAMRRLGITEGAAIEDSENGIKLRPRRGPARDRDPQPALPAADDALALADEILPNLDALRF